MSVVSDKWSEEKSFSRLSTNVIPINYNLTFNPDLNQFSFTGSETIDVLIKKPTNEIELNCLDIKINLVLFNQNGKEIKAEECKLYEDTEVLKIVFSSQLEPGKGHLCIEFTGYLNDQMRGFYRSKYINLNGESRYSAVSNFAPTHARRAFPCWDEPAVKSTFDITLICPKDRLALSNMDIISETPHNDANLKVVKFATSPIMSTYLVAFIVGENDFIEETTEDGVKVRVYTPLAKKDQGSFALEVAVKSLQFYNNFFGIPYPLPKMDLISIPDFPFSAMENWGLVTFRETGLLFDAQNSSTNRKQSIADIVSHELAHQWFGNLVTMEWWTHLWLNEGFASFMIYLCISKLYPEFDIWMQYATNTVSVALALDGLHNSHPVEIPVGHPSEVAEIFDAIAYKKGSSILGMLYNFVGNKVFSESLSLYLKKHSYKNTVTEDLWDAIEEISKKPIKNMMNTWTKQKGYPVISVTSRQDGNNRILSLKQEKFSANGKLDECDKETLWLVPISITTQSNPEKVVKKVLLETKSCEIILENITSNEWIVLNPNYVGFYRVHYTSEMLSQFLPFIRDKSIPPIDRLCLENDLFALVQEGRVSTVDLLKMIEAFIDDDNFAVWESIDNTLSQLNTLLSHTDYQENFHSFGRKVLSKIHSKLGWDAIQNESHINTMHRSLVLNRLVSFNDEEILEEAKKRFNSYIEGTYIIPADIRSAVYQGVALNADKQTFDNFFSIFRKAELSEEKNRILTSMASSTDPIKKQILLDFSLSNEVRSQDTVSIIGAVASSKIGRDLSWTFFKNNYKELYSRYDSVFMANNLVKFVTNGFASEDKAIEIEEFFSKHPYPVAERALKQSLESIRLKSQWLARDSMAIKSYLTK